MAKEIYRKHIISIEDTTLLENKCPKMKQLISYVGAIESYYIPDYFTSLINQIIFQSISYKAADTIWKRFLNLFEDITPQNILKTQNENIKVVGLSTSKVNYIKNIATAFNENTINTNFDNMSDREVQLELQKIKGIGPWTSEMFLIFCLYRKNVFSYGDIAIKNGLKLVYDIDHDLSIEEFNYYKDLYTPLGTIASFYLWEITLRKIKKEDLR